MYHSDSETTADQLRDYEQMSKAMKVDSVRFTVLWFACVIAIFWMIATERTSWPFLAMFGLKLYVFVKMMSSAVEAEHSGFHAMKLREELEDEKSISY